MAELDYRENVNKHFDDFHALKDLSINVNTGSIYGLVGTNGSGKTTIIKHLTGILRQDSGEILFDGEPVYENPALKAQIGFVPDDLSYFAPYTMKRRGEILSISLSRMGSGTL